MVEGSISVGVRIRQARLLRGLSQEALARMSGIHQTTISQIETGTTDPRSASISALARALNVTRGWLYGETGQDPTDALTNASPHGQVAEDIADYNTGPAPPVVTQAGQAEVITATRDELLQLLGPMEESARLLEQVVNMSDPRLEAVRDGIDQLKKLLDAPQS